MPTTPEPEPAPDSFGLPPVVPHLIAKLRLVDPALLAEILHTKKAA